MRCAFFCACALVSATASAAEGDAVTRPFMLWTAEEAMALSQRFRAAPWAAEKLEAIRRIPAAERSAIDNYLLFLVAGDEEAGKVEKEVLLRVVEMMTSPAYEEGRPIFLGTGMVTCENYHLAFCYDLFKDALGKEELKGCEAALRDWAMSQAGLGQGYRSRGVGWEDPRVMAACFFALAAGDRRLIRLVFERGVKPYFDGMVDGCLSPDGANPDLAMVGAMWLWCRAVARLGMDEIGFGYQGEGGGSMRRLMEGYCIVSDPQIAIPGGAPFIGRTALTLSRRLRRVSFMELRSSSYRQTDGAGVDVNTTVAAPAQPHPVEVFRAPIVIGRLRDGRGGWVAAKTYPSSVFYSYDKLPRHLVGRPEISYNRAANPESLGMLLPQVFELCHQRWPDAGFGYFLTRMAIARPDAYYPTLYWGCDPIPAPAGPPDAKSVVLPGLGMALLRAEEGPGFWESPAPYAVLRLAEGTGEDLDESALSLHGMHAFNRPIYRHETPTGIREWDRVGKGYSTVVVDNGRHPGTGRGSTRHRFDPLVKFVAARSTPYTYQESVPGEQPLTSILATKTSGVAADVDMERALALTREYLLDVVRLVGASAHTYHWQVHALGSAEGDEGSPWKPTQALDETFGADVKGRVGGSGAGSIPYTLRHGYSRQHGVNPGGDAWSVNVVQTTVAQDPERTVMGPDWYERRVGVRLTMLGEPGTGAFFAQRPLPRRLTAEELERAERMRFPLRLKPRTGDYDAADRQVTEFPVPPLTAPGKADPKTDAGSEEVGKEEKEFKAVGAVSGSYPETGGVVVIAERRATNTMFVALHEPFERMDWRIVSFSRIRQTEDAVAVAIRGRDGSAVNDRVMLRLGDRADEPITLGDGRERFSFRGFACVRVGPEHVEARGDLTAMRLRVEGSPTLVLNGERKPATVERGWLVFGE